MVAAVLAAGMFVVVVSVDPFREVRQFHPAQVWMNEDVIELPQTDQPSDIVLSSTVHSRVFRFTQDPIAVLAAIGGKKEDISSMREWLENLSEQSAEARKTVWTKKNLPLPWIGATVKLRSGREAGFFLIPKGERYTCKLVILPLTKFGFGAFVDWIIR